MNEDGVEALLAGAARWIGASIHYLHLQRSADETLPTASARRTKYAFSSNLVDRVPDHAGCSPVLIPPHVLPVFNHPHLPLMCLRSDNHRLSPLRPYCHSSLCSLYTRPLVRCRLLTGRRDSFVRSGDDYGFSYSGSRQCAQLTSVACTRSLRSFSRSHFASHTGLVY